MNNKLVTIIVPVYNAEKNLGKCLDSIIAQTYKNIEIILINDGSTDSSLDICKKYRMIHNRVKVINQENKGVSSARNKGLELAEGEYITFSDSDDYLENNMIFDMVELIEKEKTDLAICNYYDNYETNLKQVFFRDEVYNGIFDKRLFRGFLWNKLYKREIINKNNLKMDENIFITEDLLFNCEYLRYCNKVSYTNQRLYHYVMNPYSALHYKGLTQKYLTIIDSYKKIIRIFEEEEISSIDNAYLSYFKIMCDLIYRNSESNEKYNIESIINDRKKIYVKIKKSNISLKRKCECFLYYNFPIIIGKLRTAVKKGRV